MRNLRSGSIAEQLHKDLPRQAHANGASRPTSRVVDPEGDRSLEGSLIQDPDKRARPDAKLSQIAQPLGLIVLDPTDPQPFARRHVGK